MKRLLATASLLAGLCAPWWSSAWAIDDITTADAIAIHEVVQTQLEALSIDDAVSAFEQATPEKRMLIGSPDNFLRLIKEEYNPIYRYQRVIYSKPEVVNGDAIQIVRVTDGNSRVWLAVFWMQQGEDSIWRIDGCQLLETTSVSI
ncbi:DUF4864 domain-containing protein [Noviherbaspirillum denitrificans]|uniref:DUF4864 domain-containing protein n=1 Tax=Noviherbaspirillum denitrificans TaxID=1968433 RepID=A0A254THH5_9BURK|nr:DUF4864 domain-containing protein [Noviherbaspirillum denitrificans]OWW19128.1 hypothetical protein AYR66_06090 [Noviherbaspirillum denitrificans]